MGSSEKLSWKQYKRIFKKLSKELDKDFKTYRKNILNELEDMRVNLSMGISLSLQGMVPEKERRDALTEESE